MRFAHPFLIAAAGLCLGACTTTSNLSSRAGATASPVKATSEVNTPTGELLVPSDSPVAGDAPVQATPSVSSGTGADIASTVPTAPTAESKPPFLLASVPRTPAASLPTNQIMMVRTTAYCHLEADSLQYGKLSAAGNTLQYGSKTRSAAADWSKFPVGTRFTIEGLPYEYVVDDYGSALVGSETIDIYKPNMGSIGQWGVRNIPIKVIEWGSWEKSREILDSRKHVKHANHVRTMLSEIEQKAKAGTITLEAPKPTI
jgi:3D (Asp-Asp-Asp) domain-containing protein